MQYVLSIVSALLLVACPRPTRGPVTPPTNSDYEICLGKELRAPFLCDSTLKLDPKTVFECGLCEDSACVTTTFVYCVDRNLGCDDPRCTKR